MSRYFQESDIMNIKVKNHRGTYSVGLSRFSQVLKPNMVTVAFENSKTNLPQAFLYFEPFLPNFNGPKM